MCAHGAVGHWINHSWSNHGAISRTVFSAPPLVQQRLWYVLSCLRDGACKRLERAAHEIMAADFHSHLSDVISI